MLLHAVPSGGDTYKLRNELPLYGMSVCVSALCGVCVCVVYVMCVCMCTCVFLYLCQFYMCVVLFSRQGCYCGTVSHLLYTSCRIKFPQHIPVHCVYTCGHCCVLVKA